MVPEMAPEMAHTPHIGRCQYKQIGITQRQKGTVFIARNTDNDGTVAAQIHKKWWFLAPPEYAKTHTET